MSEWTSGGSLPDEASGHVIPFPSKDAPPQVAFNRNELRVIFNLYGRRVAEGDLPGGAGHHVVRREVGPPLRDVLGPAHHLEDRLRRCVDEELALDGVELGVVQVLHLSASC